MIKAAYGAYPTPEYVVMALTTDIVSLILVECTGCHLIPLTKCFDYLEFWTILKEMFSERLNKEKNCV